jgi:hypothetical protein
LVNSSKTSVRKLALFALIKAELSAHPLNNDIAIIKRHSFFIMQLLS